MNRYVPTMVLAAIFAAFIAPVSAEEPHPSNRTPGFPEAASNWIALTTVPPMRGSVGSDKPFLKMVYWCHKSDCDIDLQHQGTKNPLKSTLAGDFYRNGIPVYTLRPTQDPLVKLPHFKAVPAPWGVEATGSAGINFREYGKGGLLSSTPWVAKLELAKDQPALAKGDVVVDPDEPRETGKPLPLGFVDEGAACTPESYAWYYGANDRGRAGRAFLPIEFELEKARLAAGGRTARVFSFTLEGQPFDKIAAGIKDGNDLRSPVRFIEAARPEIMGAAEEYDKHAPAGGDEFSLFELKFLHCRMGFAGLVDPFMAEAAGSPDDPQSFVRRWRRFIHEELSYYYDRKQARPQELPPTPGDAKWAAYSADAEWTADAGKRHPVWTEMASDAKQWLEDEKIARAAKAPPSGKAAQAVRPAKAKVGRRQSETISHEMKDLYDRLQ